MENNYEFSVTNLYIAQVKRKHGILEHENYNQTGNPDGKQPQCPPDKEKAIEEALKHFLRYKNFPYGIYALYCDKIFT